MKFDPSKKISAAEIRARIEQAKSGTGMSSPSLGASPFRFADPISSAAEPLIDVLRHDDEKVEFGILDLDVYLRGMRAKELCLCVAAPHSGKTQILLTLFLNNPDMRILFLSLDDPREAILQKLVCMAHAFNGQEFETRIKENDPDYIELLRTTPTERFPNLLVSDRSMKVSELAVAIDEAEQYWGAPPQLVALDYVGLLALDKQGVEDGFQATSTKMKELKSFAKQLPCPLLVVHQATRSGGRPGERITQTSMGFAGEQEATIIVGLRRKKDDESRDPGERRRLRHTVTIDIPKLKRVGGRLTGPEGIDLFIDPDNGLIRTLYASDFDDVPEVF